MDVSFLIRKNQNFINKSHLNDYKKTKKITEKLQKREGKEAINGKVHLLKDLILLKAGRHLD